jgi:hypothetical protein
MKEKAYLWPNPLNSYDAFSANPIAHLDKVKLWALSIRLRHRLPVRAEVSRPRFLDLSSYFEYLKNVQVSVPRERKHRVRLHHVVI